MNERQAGAGLRALGRWPEKKRSRPRNTSCSDQQPPATRAALLLAALALSACGNIEPWVKPYEREALADPIMSFDPHPISTAYTHHVFEAREGARGALGSAGGGCGCN